MSKLTAAYVAGLLDGEGCFSIFARTNSGKYHSVMNGAIAVTNTDEAVIKWLKESFGGWKSEMRFNGLNRKPSCQWHMTNKEQINPFLLKVIPYLRIKKRQAQILYEFNKTYRKENLEPRPTPDSWGRIGGLRVKPSILEKRRLLMEEMRRLNQRGLQAKRLNEVAPFLG